MASSGSSKMMTALFLTFLKIGLFTFGGGYAMISLIEAECVERRKWITHDEMMNVAVIAESTPGPIAINCATYVGYSQGGVLGGIVATLGVILPSFLVIYPISLFFSDFLSIKLVASAFKGIQVAVGLLILNAAIRMIRRMKKKLLPCAILGLSFAAMLCAELLGWPISSLHIMLVAGLFSLILSALSTARAHKEGGGRS